MEENQQQLQGWTDAPDEFLITLDENGKIVQTNQLWIDFCIGHGLSETLWSTGSDYMEQLDSHGKASELHFFKQILADELSEHSQMYPLLMKNEETQWLQMKISPVKSASGTIKGIDIHYTPVMLQAIEPITAEIVLESMTDGFFLLDGHFKVIYMNEVAEELLECERRTAMGRELITLLPEFSSSSFPYHYQRALSEQTDVEFVDYYKPLDKWLKMKASPISTGGLSVNFEDISERKNSEIQLTEFAYYDYLTRLPNRKLVIKKIEHLLEQEEKFSVFHLTIDNLTFINSVYTHNAGEIIMKKVAADLKELVSETCHIGRSEGSEFLIVREAVPGDDTEKFAEHLKEIFYKPVFLGKAQKISISASIGIVRHPFDAGTMDELLSYAEMAMCEAKTEPGTSHAFFLPELITLRDRRAMIEEGLDGDLKANGFYYTLQPQIDGHTGKVVGAEVLSRWTHPALGVIPPLEFIQVAEETGQLKAMTLHLLTEVFSQLKKWEKNFGWNLPTAINMTASLLSDTAFFENFIEMIDQYEIDPKLIEIEITEQAELTYSPKTSENLLMCQSKGMSIAIDDFGTGFSMISYLTHFPITKLKIDRFFVQKIGLNSKSEAVLISLIHLAKSIDVKLVAEGVERVEEADFLLANECHVFQGFLYDRPLETSDFEKKYLLTDYPLISSNNLLLG